MKQSRLVSLGEAVANVVVGYVLAVTTQIAVFPWFGLNAAMSEHLTIGLVFLSVSLLRGYLLRRMFERLYGEKKWASARLAQLEATWRPSRSASGQRIIQARFSRHCLRIGP